MIKKIMRAVVAAAILWSPPTGEAAKGELTIEEKYERFKKAGVFQGYPDGEARLEQNITRAELAVVMSKLGGMEAGSEIDPHIQFADLQGHWVSNTNAVQYLVSNHIMLGKGNNRFDPDGLATIEEVAAVIARLFELQPSQTTITDAKISDWAHKYVGAVVDGGLIDPQLDYTAPATRAFLVDAVYMEYELAPGEAGQSAQT